MYAENTAVPIERSRAEIESIVVKAGCKQFGHLWRENMAVIEFVAKERFVRFSLPLPLRESFTHRVVRKSRMRCTEQQQNKLHEQACRQRWRALTLAIKAKFEAVAAGISEFEEEFLSNIVDPETRMTIFEIMKPQIADRYLGNPGQLRLGFQPPPAAAQSDDEP